MSTAKQHLRNGSTRPPLVDGKLRLYSMEYCPFAQRVRLVLLAKNIPHDIININSISKPKWYFQIHPEGKVPAIDTGSKIVLESLDICDWLEEKYPQNPLYPKDAAARKRAKKLIEKIEPLTVLFMWSVFRKGREGPEEIVTQFTPLLDEFENELANRGSVFFGGEKPGMVDYMLWPWGERAGTIAIAQAQELPFRSDQFPLLKKWWKAMRNIPACSQIYHGPEKFWKIVRLRYAARL